MRQACLWLESSAPPEDDGGALPSSADAVVVGGGYTGLAAARALARRGAHVVLLERETLGAGGSGRNGGFVLPGVAPDPVELVRCYGEASARALFALSLDAVAGLEQLIQEEVIACDYVRAGHLTVAARASHLPRLVATARVLARWKHPTEILDRSELRADELGSTRYYGALLDPAAGTLHPARYLAGLAAAARRAGACLHERAEALRLEPVPGGTAVVTSRGTVRAREVLIATDGYTGPLHRPLQRRVVPVGSHIIATAPLGAELARRLIPRARAVSDTRRILSYFRLSPDQRMIFGGRVSFAPAEPARWVPALRRAMTEVFPELAATPVEYSWSGAVGFTRDHLPHAGTLDGVAFALGYCGHGVALSTCLGAWMGDALAGARSLPPLPGKLSAIPLYRGDPWFLPAVDLYYRAADLVN